MSLSLRLSLFLFLVLRSAFAFSCPLDRMLCTLERQTQSGDWDSVSEASSRYLPAPGNCTVRINIANPDDPNGVYFAVASVDGNTALFTTVNGSVDFSLSAFGNGRAEPVILVNANHRLTCKLDLPSSSAD